MTSSHCRATPQKLYNYLGKDPSRLILHCLFQVCRTNHSRTHVTILSRQKYGKCILKRMSVPGTSLTTLSQYFVVLQMIKLNFFLGSYYMYHCRSPMLRSHYLKKIQIIFYSSQSCAPWDFDPLWLNRKKLSQWHWNTLQAVFFPPSYIFSSTQWTEGKVLLNCVKLATKLLIPFDLSTWPEKRMEFHVAMYANSSAQKSFLLFILKEMYIYLCTVREGLYAWDKVFSRTIERSWPILN